MLTKLTVVIILQYIHIANHYDVDLKQMQDRMSITFNKTGGERLKGLILGMMG